MPGSSSSQSNVLSNLAGRIACMAAPAEEFVEIEYRSDLKRQGKIEFLGGKPELVRPGHLDDVYTAMLVHAAAGSPGRKLMYDSTTNGFVAKTFRFRGKEAHAGMAPEKGVNALNALDSRDHEHQRAAHTVAYEDLAYVMPAKARAMAIIDLARSTSKVKLNSLLNRAGRIGDGACKGRGIAALCEALQSSDPTGFVGRLRGHATDYVERSSGRLVAEARNRRRYSICVAV